MKPRLLSIAAIFLPLAGAVTTVQAQTGAETVSCGEEREVRPSGLTEGTFNRLNVALEMIAEEEYDAAMAEMERLAQARLTDYEKATVQQYLGFLAAQREQYRRSIEHFSAAVRLNQLPNQTHFDIILQIAQLYNAIEEYDLALEQLDFWFCIATEDAKKTADVWMLKASLHVQKEEWRPALSAVDQALALSDDPPESWFRFKLGMLQQLEEHRESVDVLKILVGMDPDRKEYWLQLSGTYQELNEQENAMSAMRLAYRRDLLDRSSEFTQLAGLLQQMEAPRQAAEVLEDGLQKGIVDATASNWEMAAGAWYQAREMRKALDAFAQAGRLSDSGRLDYQRAQLLIAEEDWQSALTAVNAALEKGDLNESQTGNSYLLIGMAHFNLDNFDQAEQAFQRAANYGTLRSAAQEWLNHIAQTRQQLAIR
ncbi:MAG: tetratricopeptide repeat protein [Wenzhouxiangellaceae bacterium]